MKESFVYVVTVTKAGRPVAPCKIGLSDNPSRRVAQVALMSPLPIKLIHSYRMPNRESARRVEHSFHEVMKEHRLHGEWFKLSPERALASVNLAIIAAGQCVLGPCSKEMADAFLEATGVVGATAKIKFMRGEGPP